MRGRNPVITWIDLETSGLYFAKGHEICELAAVRVDVSGNVLASLHVHVWPIDLTKTDPEALAKNGFDRARSEREGVTKEEMRARLEAFLGKEVGIVAAQNAAFDLSFLPWLRPRYVLDPISMLWARYLRGELKALNLDELCRAYQIESHLSRHTALGDIDRCMAIYAHITNTPRPLLGPEWDHKPANTITTERKAG